MVTVVLTGGGSGGHITPILAVAAELKRLRPDYHLVYIGQKGDPLAEVPRQSSLIDETHLIRAGKLRRYHGEGLRQLIDAPTIAKNTRDAFRVVTGLTEAYRLLGRLKPALIYTPGGYVNVPVGLAAAKRKIPVVTHDLDALPSLANRINARWAAVHAVGMPPEMYAYAPEKTVYVGVPVNSSFVTVTQKLQQSYRRATGLDRFDQIVFVVGGGLGAQRLNEAMLGLVDKLLRDHSRLGIVHVAGAKHETTVRAAYHQLLRPDDADRVIVKGFVNDLYMYSGAADVVITRAGASNIAEFAIQAKPCIVVPNPVLSGGHQLKNIEPLQAADAVVVVPEADLNGPSGLLMALNQLLADPNRCHQLGEAIGRFAKPRAAADLAKLLIKVAEQPGAF